MKPLSETLRAQGIAYANPIEIKDSNGNVTFFVNSDDYWWKREYDANGE